MTRREFEEGDEVYMYGGGGGGGGEEPAPAPAPENNLVAAG